MGYNNQKEVIIDFKLKKKWLNSFRLNPDLKKRLAGVFRIIIVIFYY